jgi:hypothetical protein
VSTPRLARPVSSIAKKRKAFAHRPHPTPNHSRDTFDENMQNGLFGLTQPSWPFVKRITPGMPLFLYNLTEKRFHGVFEAVSGANSCVAFLLDLSG